MLPLMSGRRIILDSYARESSRGDKRDLSITGQHGVNEGRIAELGATLGLRLDDKGKSAWNQKVARPNWERMIQRMESGESDGAVIYDLERLMRRVESALRIVKLVERERARGRTLYIYDSDLEYDLTTPSGQEAFYQAAVAGQKYSHRLSGKVTRGNATKARNGEGKRGRWRAFGFEDDSTTVREPERVAIRYIVDKILDEGWTWTQCVAYLTSIGIMSTAIQHTEECKATTESLTRFQLRSYTCECTGLPWIQSALKTALQNERMAGYAKIGEGLGKLPGEPILELSRWQQLKELIASRRGAPPREDSLASGKRAPVRCWNCGNIIGSRDNGHGTTYRNDGQHYASVIPEERMDDVKRVYHCRGTVNKRTERKGCGKNLGDYYVINQVIEEMVIRQLSSVESAEELAKLQQKKRDDRSPHETELSRLEKVRDYWDKQLNEGAEGMTPERHAFMVADVNVKIKEVKKKLESIGEVKSITPVVESREAVKAKWAAAEPAKKRQMLQQAFGERTIYIVPGSTLDLVPAAMGRIRAIPKEGVEPESR